MGDREGWAQPPGFLPNGLVPNGSVSITRNIDAERLAKAEERTADLIAHIQPNKPSEERRNAVADYVQRLIMKCFSCQVFTFGSVPLKTYLPDGDIDLTAFSNNQNVKDTWAQEVRDMLENEEKSDNAEFLVKEVQYIQAEVKIIKCLVENIVVDISFNQLGGLCTLCFLEEVDHLINQNHLCKRSIILIKAWCYYESRILGAHHGLISTYALETLVLYIFHVFNNSFSGPLEVLYRFLEFFSNFDWDNFCVSLWGPVPIRSLPNTAAEPPRRDGGDLLLSKHFLDECSTVYSVFPGGQENQGYPFVSKYFNVIDPLRTNNNLGRSVSKGNFFRIRSAFAFGAKRLAHLLECPKEDIVAELNQFFMNTWDRHGSGNRPDAPIRELWPPQPFSPELADASVNSRNCMPIKKKCGTIKLPAGRESQAEDPPAYHGTISPAIKSTVHPSDNLARSANMPAVSRFQSHKVQSNQTNLRASDQVARRISPSDTNTQAEKIQKSSRQDYLVNDHEGMNRYNFVRTQSSPELTDTSIEVTSRGRRNRVSDTEKSQFVSTRSDHGSRRKTIDSEVSASHSSRSSIDDHSSLRHSSSHQSADAAGDLNSVTNSYHDESGLGAMGDDLVSAVETMDVLPDMHQEEQDLVNKMASSRVPNFNGQVQLPLNFTAGHLPFPISHSVLASLGCNQRNLVGIVPANIPLMDPSWGSNMQFPQGMVSSAVPQYFPTVGLASNPEEMVGSGNENSSVTDFNQEDDDFWQQQEADCTRGYDSENVNAQILQSDYKKHATPGSLNFLPSRFSSSDSSSMGSQPKFVRENKGLIKEDHVDILQYQYNRSDVHNTKRNSNFRFTPVAQPSSSRSKISSENSCDGSPSKTLKSRDKRGRKMTGPSFPSAYGQSKGGRQYESTSLDHVSSLADDDSREWTSISSLGSEMGPDGSVRPAPVSPQHRQNHQLLGYEQGQLGGLEPVIPIAPMLVGSGSRQRPMDSSGVVPYAFYPTGPPVPFFTMLPVYNIPHETGNSEASTSHVDRNDGLDNSHTIHSDQNFDYTGSVDLSDNVTSSIPIKGPSMDFPEEHKADILNSDFVSHLQNLKYGRLCQSSRYQESLIYPSSVMVPPVYLQGHFPWDGPGRPLSANVNLFTQRMSNGPQLVPIAPLQTSSNRPASVYQRYGDEVPRYRGGTGTYLPNHKVSFKDRQSSSARNHKGSYNYDLNDHGDREWNWNNNSKSRVRGRGQAEKFNSRPERMGATDVPADRQWDSYRHEPLASYQVQNGPFSSSSPIHGSTNMAYGGYPLPTMTANCDTPAGPAVPSVVMLYSYDQNSNYISPSEQLEFGSLGPMQLSGMNESSQIGDGCPARGSYHQRHSAYQGRYPAQSSSNQPSSPQRQRGI